MIKEPKSINEGYAAGKEVTQSIQEETNLSISKSKNSHVQSNHPLDVIEENFEMMESTNRVKEKITKIKLNSKVINLPQYLQQNQTMFRNVDRYLRGQVQYQHRLNPMPVENTPLEKKLSPTRSKDKKRHYQSSYMEIDAEEPKMKVLNFTSPEFKKYRKELENAAKSRHNNFALRIKQSEEYVKHVRNGNSIFTQKSLNETSAENLHMDYYS